MEMLTGVPLPSSYRDESNTKEPKLPAAVADKLTPAFLTNFKAFLTMCFATRSDCKTQHLVQHKFIANAMHSDVVRTALEGATYRMLETRVADRASAFKKSGDEEVTRHNRSGGRLIPSAKDASSPQSGDAARVAGVFGKGRDVSGVAKPSIPLAKLQGGPQGAGGATPRRVVVKIN